MTHEYDAQIKDLNAQRLQTWEQAKGLLDHAAAEKRALSAEETEQYGRMESDLDSLAKRVEQIETAATRTAEMEGIREEFNRVVKPTVMADHREAEQRTMSEFFKRGGSVTALEIDLRPAARAYEAKRAGFDGPEFRVLASDSVASSGGSLFIPTEMSTTLYSYLTASTAMRKTHATIIRTAGGNPIDFPKVGTHGIATMVATQNTAFAGTDPVFAKMTLNAYDYGQLVAVGADFLEDTGVDILGFVAKNIARAIGEVTDTDYVTGSGSSKPNGIQTAIVGAGTIATGGSLITPTVENLIDLEFSVADGYRNADSGWIMNDLTVAKVRKLRDGAGGTVGAFLWEPSLTAGIAGGQPDRMFSYPVYADTNVASCASNAKIVYFGDLSAVYIRDAGSFRLERSDDLYFNLNQVAFRGLIRTDSDVIDLNAINCLKQSV